MLGKGEIKMVKELEKTDEYTLGYIDGYNKGLDECWTAYEKVFKILDKMFKLLSGIVNTVDNVPKYPNCNELVFWENLLPKIKKVLKRYNDKKIK